MTTWRCAACSNETRSQNQPGEACANCGELRWEEVLRGEDGFGDHFRPGDG